MPLTRAPEPRQGGFLKYVVQGLVDVLHDLIGEPFQVLKDNMVANQAKWEQLSAEAKAKAAAEAAATEAAAQVHDCCTA